MRYVQHNGPAKIRSSGKLNSDGVFLPWPGITVVSAVDPKNVDWGRIQSYICAQPTMSRYFAALPASSYHITICGVTTASKHHDMPWDTYLQRNETSIVKMAQQVRAQRPIQMCTPILVKVGTRISLVFEFDDSTRAAVEKMCASLGHRMSSPFHISLAYEKESPPKEGRDKVALKEELDGLRLVATELLNSAQGWLQPPQLCYFPDMTRFLPWDGTLAQLKTLQQKQDE